MSLPSMQLLIKAFRRSIGGVAAMEQLREVVDLQKQTKALCLYVAKLTIKLAFLFGMLVMVASAPMEDLIESLPGQPNVTFKQYGGFVTVDADHGRALYYYFVEAESDADSKPLTLWLNGGPGCSSLGGGAFSELGPFYVNGKGLSKNSYAWNKVSNILFLESPAGVGFSYSNTTSDYKTGDNKTAQDTLIFLLEWFKKFSTYQGQDLYLAGESYAGHYIPQLAKAILESNAKQQSLQIELKGVMVGNPLFDIFIDRVASPITFLWSHGLMSEESHEQIVLFCRLDRSDESKACKQAIGQSIGETGISRAINAYDVLADVCTQVFAAAEAHQLIKHVNQNLEINLDAQVSPCIEGQEATYLNLQAVQYALHGKITSWSICTRSLSYNNTDLAIPIVPVLKDLVKSGLRLWVFSGDQDSVIPLIGTRQLVDQVAKELNLIQASSYRVWFEGEQAGGWTTSWGTLTYATVRGAGHMVPATQPSRALQLFTSFIHGTPLPTIP